MKNLVTIFIIAAVLVSSAMTVVLVPALSFALVDGPVKVTVRVDGLSCPFCAYGLEKKVRQMEGVLAFTINIKRGEVEVIFEDRGSFDREGLVEAVREAGFTPKKVKVEDIKTEEIND